MDEAPIQDGDAILPDGWMGHPEVIFRRAHPVFVSDDFRVYRDTGDRITLEIFNHREREWEETQLSLEEPKDELIISLAIELERFKKRLIQRDPTYAQEEAAYAHHATEEGQEDTHDSGESSFGTFTRIP